MTRHAKNVTAGNVYTSHEKAKDARQSGYGTRALRLGKDSIKEFDCCSLTLQPCKDAVITPDGHLYDKEPILENILHQKREIARKMKEYEKQKRKRQKEELEKSKTADAEKYKKFLEKQSAATKVQADTSKDAAASVSNIQHGRDKELPSFWIPSLTPNSKPTEISKPDETVRCSMSGKALRLKDLIPVKFSLAKDGDSRSLITKDGRYVCAVTNDLLGNSVPCAVMKTSGNVVTLDCVERIIKKDWIDPTNGMKLKEKDIIPLQRGATGFAGAGISLEAKKAGAVMQA